MEATILPARAEQDSGSERGTGAAEDVASDRPSEWPTAGNMLRGELIENWLRAVVRRGLSERERRTLSLNWFVGGPGVAELGGRGLRVTPQRGAPFEAVAWDTNVRELQVEALLCTPSEMQFLPVAPEQAAVVVLQVVSGVLLRSSPTNTAVVSAGDVVVLEPDPDPERALRLHTRGTFAAICVTLPTPEGFGWSRAHLSHEATRLRAVVELGRACLVGQLERKSRVDKDAWILRELLVTERSPRDRSTVARSSARVRDRVLSLIAAEHTDPEFSVQRIVSCFEISRRQLYRSVPSERGSLAELILGSRLETAIGLLRQRPTLSIERVAAASGFSSSDQFRRAFRRVHGTTPVQYRQTHTDGADRSLPTP